MMMMMMMMMMTLMKLVNSGTKFRPGIDKFYQPNSGCAQFQEGGRGYIYIYTYIHIYIYIYIYTIYIYIYIYICCLVGSPIQHVGCTFLGPINATWLLSQLECWVCIHRPVYSNSLRQPSKLNHRKFIPSILLLNINEHPRLNHIHWMHVQNYRN